MKIKLAVIMILVAQNANSGFMDTLKQGWDKTGDVVSELTTSSITEKIPLSKQQAREVWDEMSDHFSDIEALKIDEINAPESSFFYKTKVDISAKILDIVGQVASLLKDTKITEDRLDMDKLDISISEAIKTQSEYTMKANLSGGDDKLDLLDDIEQQQILISELENTKLELVEKIRDRLGEYGLVLSSSQVKVLLTRVDADDIIAMATTFSIISELTQQLSESMAVSGEDINVAKKYYGFHVMLLELQRHIQKTYIGKLEKNYIVKLNDIKSDNENLIRKTKGLIKSSNSSIKKIYKGNLKSQRYTNKVIGVYKKILVTDLTKLKKGLSKINKNYKVALNTLDTVSISSDLASLMSDNKNLFKEIMSLQIPELIPFENLQMQKEFEALSIKIGSTK